ncbi:mitochondrial enolase superfamily member 1 [Seriola dumerili]|uniref:Mitochondrial enolase superfamily member 1 n=1 Tax=Seriola dumerili TaxID=41447 RepID=A0A3B4TXM3_SERDU|nr:mitochondrial enolase superfamily member 1 [Seriola dumerili]
MLQRVISLTVRDVRFQTSLEQHGSDAMHTDPDYSAAYVVIDTDCGLKGFGLTFTLGKGTEIVVRAVDALAGLVVGKSLQEIVSDFRGFYRLLTSDGQMRWLGPEKGVIHLATAAVLNAVWDLWARAEDKPLWKLLVDMDPKQIVSCIDFRYITDALTEEEAVDILVNAQEGKKRREDQMLKEGYPAYTTSCAWLGYPDQQLKQLCTDALEGGWTKFKVKVGADLEDDIRRCRLIRQMIGPNNTLMIDANQRWDVGEAISWVSRLSEFKPLWIEEPTSPDDILGHAAISKALAPLGIGVATGEQCANRVMFKQFLQASALQFVQIDSCRLGSVNENLAVLLMAHKFNVPVCPHAGGVGLCELVQHLILFDYICVSASLSDRMCEYVDHLHEHFVNPVVIQDAHYMPPKDPGYSCEMLESSVQRHQYPEGEAWKAAHEQMTKA